jgi:hypothetical protein
MTPFFLFTTFYYLSDALELWNSGNSGEGRFALIAVAA